jgi:phosphoribosylformylglycinamidine cyclo-ligase
MLETFNLGIGFVLIIPPEQKEITLNWFQSQGINAFHLGHVIEGNQSLSIL